MSNQIQVLQADLRNATVKEISDCMRAVNETLGTQQKLVVSGKKEDIINRFCAYIGNLLINKRTTSLSNVVKIVNETAPRKLSWEYEADPIKITVQKAKRATTCAQSINQISFVPSPFIKPVCRLTSIKVCPVAGQARQSRSFSFTLTEENRRLLATHNAVDERPPYQIRFYCAKYTGATEQLQLEFPGICELKINENVIPGHSLRCLKSKPGTVNPPDLSIMIRKSAQNNIELIYINSEFPFIASAYIVERTPVQTLIDTMKSTRVLSKEQVLKKLQEVQEDADISMESETVSTKCPLAFTRIVTPIRSKSCNHLQCFDATTFLTMNEQTPTWSCPVCQRRIETWEDLIVDEFFSQMLVNTPKHIDSVRVEPSGVVTIIDENPDLAEEESEEEEIPEIKPEPEVTILLDDDDDEEGANISTANNSIPVPVAAASPTSGAKRAFSPELIDQSQQQQSRKKQKSDVIDLTLDSEDESDDTGIKSRSSR
ncbi:PINIT domain-containing protein [Mucor mucedo]|uniref:PINIT domain-containing protein n=1 Tax=Mucor mucedo TaxID=29922 RepID=UPI0022206FA7|nr:PINIT domain-containing protein [Mucor mucedo]KAI7895266.1 PINIT domain-containing protein [Mucor mucedo]